MKKNKLLILDDDEKLRFNLQLFFEDEGFVCAVFDSAEEALRELHKTTFDAAIVDLRLPGKNGIDFINEAYKINPEMKCILYTGSNNFQVTNDLEGINLSSDDVFLKPVDDMNILLKKLLNKLKDN